MKRIRSQLPKLWLRASNIKYGKNLCLHGYPFIFRYPKAEIMIGNNVMLNSSFFSNFIGLYQRNVIVARGIGKIKIGNHVGMSGVTLYARESITIGDDTIIGANTKIFDNDFHSLNPEERRKEDVSNLICKPVIIGKNVFIGCNCIILKGAEIGDDCVVGAGSVVGGKFEKGSKIVGNPCRSIS